MSNSKKVKILVVGFDGATWSIIKPLVDQGKMPTFKYLMEKGTWGPLRSTIPPITIPAWISMFSGKKPESLGIFDFGVFKIENNELKYHLVSSKFFSGQFIWDLASNIKSLVLSIPGTYPPYPSCRVHIVGFDFTPLENVTYPKELEKILIKEIKIDRIKEIQKNINKSKDLALKVIYEEENTILTILKTFYRKFDYDVIFVRFGIPDQVSHVSTEEEDMIACHMVMDNILKSIIEDIKFEYLLIVSDHGLKKINEHWFINNSLEKLGLLKIKPKYRVFRYFRDFLYKIKLLGFVKDLHMKLTKMEKNRHLIYDNFTLNAIDLKNTKIFGYGGTNFCPVYIIDEKNKNLILNKLKELPNVRKIYLIKKDIKGSNGFLIPSAIVESEKRIDSSLTSRKIEVRGEHWTHDMYGIFLAYGPGIKKGYKIDNATVYDIAPTILYILGLPIPNDMDGKVLMEIFERNSKFSKIKPTYVDPRYYETIKERDKIKLKIRKLKFKREI